MAGLSSAALNSTLEAAAGLKLIRPALSIHVLLFGVLYLSLSLSTLNSLLLFFIFFINVKLLFLFSHFIQRLPASESW